MFDIKLKINDIQVMSIEKDDISDTYSWFKEEYNYLDENNPYELSESQFYDRFIEYYLSECEFFTKVIMGDELIGIFKGRIEFRNPNKVWIGYLLIGERYRNKGIGTKVLNSMINYFNIEFGIFNFYTKLKENDIKSIDFWKKNSFIVSQLSNKNRLIEDIVLKRTK
jgi:RimJ/RimL family protein N-acetyltransferase